MNGLQLRAHSDLQHYILQILVVAISETKKMLSYKEMTKGGPSTSEDSQERNKYGNKNKKDKGKVKPFGKSSKDKAKQPNVPREKYNPISCLIFVQTLFWKELSNEVEFVHLLHK